MTKRAKLGTLAALLLVGGAACSDDETGDDGASTTQTTVAAEDTYEALLEVMEGTGSAGIEQVSSIIEERLDSLGLSSGAEVVEEPPNRLRITLTGGAEDDWRAALELVIVNPSLQFRPVLATIPGGGDGPDLELPGDDDPAAPVALGQWDGPDVVTVYELGPAGATGDIVESAQTTTDPAGAGMIALVLEDGNGIERFNALAADCFARSATCPTGQLAIVLDSKVVSAPTIQQPSFEADQISISGVNEREARGVALALSTASSGLPDLELVSLEPQ